ncbi:MAG: hypothetical protein E6Q97_36065 [Desulfurellales bacterium]|nr:MAG: hypothetical protein E6Q97_36065 [Desulfurellales bacterium]
MHLPESKRAQLDILLHSGLEGRVPKGAYQRFFLDRLDEFFATKTLDLAPYLGTMPGEAVIRGRKEVLERLQQLLEGGQ